MMKMSICSSTAFLLCIGTLETRAGGIYGSGVGAQSMAMGGADVAWAAGPLGAMGENPAGLGFLTGSQLDFGGVGSVVQGSFNKPGVSTGNLEEIPAGLPEGALGIPLKLGKWPVTVGLSFVPESALLADWHYLDPPGGLGGKTSYGFQQDRSQIIELRSALGAGIQITPNFSFGASIGVIYNENNLDAPYIFQNLQPGAGGPNNVGLNGAKTLLKLQTSGYGYDGQFGMLYHATTNLQFGLAYETECKVNSSGDAFGDPSVQFGAPLGTLPFHYHANVQNIFPQDVTGGASWKFYPNWRAAVQLDWIDWADAFHTLPVSLSGGSNPTVDGALGSNFKDLVPLNWKDEIVYRIGLEYDIIRNVALRLGYSYGSSPVPDSSLTPMTAAIMENTITGGIGYHWRQFQFDLAYQYSFPATQNVGSSGLLSGEYSNSSIEVSMHTIAFTTSWNF